MRINVVYLIYKPMFLKGTKERLKIVVDITLSLLYR